MTIEYLTPKMEQTLLPTMRPLFFDTSHYDMPSAAADKVPDNVNQYLMGLW